MFLSNAVDPEMVARNVRKAAEARQMLGDELGVVILEPLDQGVFDERSYVVWPWCHSFSRFRVRYAVQKRIFIPRILSWMRKMTQHTRCMLSNEQMNTKYHAPLHYLEEESRFRLTVRDNARIALERMASGAWHPHGVLEHNDFWIGNVLLPSHAKAGTDNPLGFYIIDWAGASLPGRALLDTVRFHMSGNLAAHRCAKELVFYTDELGFEPVDAMSYVLAGLGAIGLNLGHFPFDRYMTLCDRVFDYVESARND